MRRQWGSLCAVVALAAAAPAGAADAEKDLLGAKCTLCHTSDRIYTTDTSKLAELVARMTAKNPEWFRGVDSPHLMGALTAMLSDPQVAAQRAAWEKTVARGRALFLDRTLGSTGKACGDCHPEGSLGRVKDQYPKFNPELGRFESIDERVAGMISRKLGGEAPALGDERLGALVLYLRSLR